MRSVTLCCSEYVDRHGSLCFSVCASRAGLTPSPTCPSLGKVASAKAEMWPLRQPNGDATRQPSSVRTDGGFFNAQRLRPEDGPHPAPTPQREREPEREPEP